jgi:hypothetical protein
LGATGARQFPQHAVESAFLVTAANPPNGAHMNSDN